MELLRQMVSWKGQEYATSVRQAAHVGQSAQVKLSAATGEEIKSHDEVSTPQTSSARFAARSIYATLPVM